VHHVGILCDQFMMHGQRNIKLGQQYSNDNNIRMTPTLISILNDSEDGML